MDLSVINNELRTFLPCGHCWQSFVFLIAEPTQIDPPLLGGGLVQVLVLIFPNGKVDPGHLQSVQGDHCDQPPLTEKN